MWMHDVRRIVSKHWNMEKWATIPSCRISSCSSSELRALIAALTDRGKHVLLLIRWEANEICNLLGSRILFEAHPRVHAWERIPMSASMVGKRNNCYQINFVVPELEGFTIAGTLEGCIFPVYNLIKRTPVETYFPMHCHEFPLQ